MLSNKESISESNLFSDQLSHSWTRFCCWINVAVHFVTVSRYLATIALERTTIWSFVDSFLSNSLLLALLRGSKFASQYLSSKLFTISNMRYWLYDSNAIDPILCCPCLDKFFISIRDITYHFDTTLLKFTNWRGINRRDSRQWGDWLSIGRND